LSGGAIGKVIGGEKKVVFYRKAGLGGGSLKTVGNFGKPSLCVISTWRGSRDYVKKTCARKKARETGKSVNSVKILVKGKKRLSPKTPERVGGG